MEKKFLAHFVLHGGARLWARPNKPDIRGAGRLAWHDNAKNPLEIPWGRGHPSLLGEYPLIKPRYEREPDSVPGPFYVVRHTCLICALPTDTAPENISWSKKTFKFGCEDCPAHCRIERQPQTPTELALVIEAACGSCVEAIRYCGTDPQILATFRELGYERLCDAQI